MFTVEQEEKIKAIASKRDLNYALKQLSKAGAYQTLTALNLAEKPFDKELRAKTVSTITSSIIQGMATIYALGGVAEASDLADNLLTKWTEVAHV